MRAFLLVLSAALLAGCAAQLPQQQQQQRMADYEQRIFSLYADYTNAINGNRRLDPTRDKINLADPRNPTLAMLSLTSVPSNEEKNALAEWQGMQTGFRDQTVALQQQYAPWDVPLLELTWAAGLSNLTDLCVGKITYGEFNRRRLELLARYTQAGQQRLEEIQRQQLQAAQAQAQIAAQQSIATSAAISTFQNYLIGQQLINQQMQPVRMAPFTCTRFGNITNCY